MSETYGLRLTCAQRLVASDLLPELADRLMLDTRNERTIPLTQKQIERLRDAASKAIRDAPTGTERNSLRHIVDKSSDLLTRESAAKEIMRLKVTLVGSDPLIWRRIETHDCSLATLHDIIQVAMRKFFACWLTEAESGLAVQGEIQQPRVPRCRNTRKYRSTIPFIVHIGLETKSHCHSVSA